MSTGNGPCSSPVLDVGTDERGKRKQAPGGGETAVVAAGDVRDPYGEINGDPWKAVAAPPQHPGLPTVG